MVRPQHGRRRSGDILFASEFPSNEKAFSFALAHALETKSNLILFHVYDHPNEAGSLRHHGRDAAALSAKIRFEPLARHANELGIDCKVVVRPGHPAEEILNFMRERKIDQLVMGAHTSGPVGKILVGSVAEALLRTADVPVNIIGPYVVEGAYRNSSTHTIMCSVSANRAGRVVTSIAAELAAKHNARLILLRVIPPQDAAEELDGRSLREIESEVLGMVPIQLRKELTLQAHVVLGDPTEELLYQGRVQQANLIVLGAEAASHFAAVTNSGIVYKVLAYARCPVMVLSRAVLAQHGDNDRTEAVSLVESNYLAGVF